ncbi:MAG: aldo/keto reductase [Chloroflexi bacterium]|nr:aldo/keto reductase [Chloroflexota bacterium]
METQTIGTTGIETTRMAFGNGRILGMNWRTRDRVTDEEFERAVTAIMTAYEAGIRCYDNADIYCRGVSEEVMGEVLRRVPGMRDEVTIITKCSSVQPPNPDPAVTVWYDQSEAHIVASVEGSLKRMGIERVDMLLLHFPDALWNPHEVAEAFRKLHAQGKVRHFGVSNFSPSQVRALARWCDLPLVANEIEFSLSHTEPIKDGVLDQCYELSMTPIGYGPVDIGRLVNEQAVKPDDPRRPRYERLWPALDRSAAEHGVSRTAIAIAWILAHPIKVLPIIGALTPERIRDAVTAFDVKMEREEWYRLFWAAGGWSH